MDSLREYANNEYLASALLIFVIVYASKAQVELPDWLSALFKNDIFKILYLSLLLMIPFDKAPHVSIIVAVLFVVILNTINRTEMKAESLRNTRR